MIKPNENYWDFVRRMGHFNKISDVYSCLDSTRKRHGMSTSVNIECFVSRNHTIPDLPRPNNWVEARYYESKWNKLPHLMEWYLKSLEEYEKWRRDLAKGKLDVGEFLISCHLNSQQDLGSASSEILQQIGELKSSSDSMQFLAANIPIKDLPNFLKQQRRELILREAQITRAYHLLGKIPEALRSCLPADSQYYRTAPNEEKQMGVEEILARQEEANELIEIANPLRFNEDHLRYIGNLYDFFNIPTELRKQKPIYFH